MMDWTDRHCRYFHRLLSRHAFLYTEMVTTGALIYGERDRHLSFHPAEHPVALQLGGSDAGQLARCAAYGARAGYDEINFNCGCPSDRVQNGRFGACLMAEPGLVSKCIAAMREAVAGSIPVTVKCRIGIDDQDSEADLSRFVAAAADGGCEIFIIHARKAWLSGLSPKQNRDIPPLDYGRVYRLKAAFPQLTIILNGGLPDLSGASAALNNLDGVMLGRAAYKNPAMLLDVDRMFYGSHHSPRSLVDILVQMKDYAKLELEHGTRLASITRHMNGLLNGMDGARAFRRLMTEEAVRHGADLSLFDKAQELVIAAENGQTHCRAA
jgi:tRNA-dihydrouridine synthase A